MTQSGLAEERLHQFAQGERGTLRISMECHPCYHADVKQIQCGDIGALCGCEADFLVTPDPLYKTGLKFIPVFDYEQMLVFYARSLSCDSQIHQTAAAHE